MCYILSFKKKNLDFFFVIGTFLNYLKHVCSSVVKCMEKAWGVIP